jgi:hypothetical protein
MNIFKRVFPVVLLLSFFIRLFFVKFTYVDTIIFTILTLYAIISEYVVFETKHKELKAMIDSQNEVIEKHDLYIESVKRELKETQSSFNAYKSLQTGKKYGR